MARVKKAADKVIDTANGPEVVVPEIRDTDHVVVVGLEGNKFLTPGKDYPVGGATAKELIRKGFAKLKD